jgi:pimeloyl-ACP methyl ester carboxylesterase
MQVQANGLSIEVDVQGPPPAAGGQPLVLIMGLGMQLLGWPEELVAELAARGFCVIRLDNRDAGLSSGFDHLGVPNLPWAAMRHWLRLPVAAPYGIADMAEDTRGVLDALGIDSAHICGASMGGMVAQHLAARHPARVRSLTLLMTTSGARHLPQAAMQVQRALLSRPDGRNADAVVAHLERILKLIGSPGWPSPPERTRQRLRESVERAWRPAGTARQLVAVAADGDRTPMLGRIAAPTRVVHGAADPLVPPAAAHDLATRIHGAELELIPGMGHDLPLALLPRLAEGIAATAGRADRTRVRSASP